MELRPRKRIRPSVDVGERDRLSEMPDEVIVHILSCMPILDAVRTVLLRRFGNLWTLVHTLKLDMEEMLSSFSMDYEYEEDDDEWFCIFVRNVLILHKRPSIDKFHLSLEFCTSSEKTKAADDVKTWLRFALDRQANKIKFSGGCDFGSTGTLLLPNFTSQSLVTLELSSCKIETRLQVKLPSLKKLSLDHCFMSNEDLQRFMSGCPSLRELVIKNPSDMGKLSFSAPNVDKLSLVLYFNFPRRNPLLLDCPNLKTLDLEIYDPLDVIDVSSVRTIYVKKYLHRYGADKHTMLRLFYEKLDRVEVIHLSCVESLQFLDAIQYLHLLQNKWKCVVLELKEFCQVCLVGISHLIRRLRCLEELIIYTTEDFKASSDLPPFEVSSSHVEPKLKTITLHGYRKSWKSQLQLVEFLLKSAAHLEKLVIVPIKHRLEGAEELEFVKSVSSFPRASTSARVLFA